VKKFMSMEVKLLFKHFLVPLDGSALAECVLPHTLALARAFQGRVTLLRVLALPESGAPVDAFDWQMEKAEAEAYLGNLAVRLQTAGVATDTAVIAGQPTDSVIDYVHNHQIDLLVLSSHGENGVTDWHMGSVVQKILLRSRISSLLVRADEYIQTAQTDLRYQRLLAPLDGSLRATHALPFVSTLARFYDARLLVVHVLSKPDMPRHMPLSPADKALTQQLTAHNNEAVTSHFDQLKSRLPAATDFRLLEHEDVAACLHELAETEQSDLVILSAHGYSGGSRWPYGSITTNLIANGMTPLLLVQDWPADWTSTVAGGAVEETASGPMPSARPANWMASGQVVDFSVKTMD
jgi:nucleotide-binding universal stress UspA family protein